MVSERNLNGFWIHLDVDVLNDAIMPSVDSRQSGGLTYTKLISLLSILLQSPKCIGMEITILDPDLDLGATVLRGSDLQSFVLEFILTFLLMMVILTSMAKKDHSLLGPALAIGGTVGLEALFAGLICGASMNPARSLSPAIVGGNYQSLWVYILGPALGAFVGSFGFRRIKENDDPITKSTN